MMMAQLSLQQRKGQVRVVSQLRKSSEWIDWGRLVYPVYLRQCREQCLELKRLLPFLPLRTSSRMSATRPRPNWQTGFIPPMNTQTTCGWTASMPKACERTGARVNLDVRHFEFGTSHPHALGFWNTVVIHDLLPCLDDYISNTHDPFVEDFI